MSDVQEPTHQPPMALVVRFKNRHAPRVRDGYVSPSACGHTRSPATGAERQICRTNALTNDRACTRVPSQNFPGFLLPIPKPQTTSFVRRGTTIVEDGRTAENAAVKPLRPYTASSPSSGDRFWGQSGALPCLVRQRRLIQPRVRALFAGGAAKPGQPACRCVARSSGDDRRLAQRRRRLCDRSHRHDPRRIRSLASQRICPAPPAASAACGGFQHALAATRESARISVPVR
jgi:hypothetical protein